ncbi:MAG: nucleotidyl transferase AbiEii/AbiGii toxin family protein [Bacteroidales bacterium]|nr:nucleotidyl transferase AbiEii/AbiGii toxin family protein [Bacteroidales bacterium]
MLHYETISSDTLNLFKRLASLDELSEARLAGGTALALQIGHRKSIDLDFFGHIDYSMDELKMAMESVSGDVQPINSTKTMRFYVVEGVKIDVVNYPYPWIGESVVDDGLVLAGVEDIAAMKLAAITNRGTKKDFIDLFFLLKTYSLSQMLDMYLEKYSGSQLFTVLKSLVYFVDAESDPMPNMLQTVTWEEVKAKIIVSVNDFIRE